MILPLLIVQAAALPPTSPVPTEVACAAFAARDPAAARGSAERWQTAGGGAAARACIADSYAREGNWPAAAAAFEAAAHDTETARQPAARFWAQAGNAWLAAGDAARARAALDAALAAGTLTGLDLGEAQLDRARALVAAGNTAAARIDLDLALKNAAADPLAWLLSATLARRTGDLSRARTDIAGALARAADDASVQLEAGNIAAASGDEPGARRAWTEAARLAPGRPAGRSATAALAQFGTPTDTKSATKVESVR
jgi:hypothetical protein